MWRSHWQRGGRRPSRPAGQLRGPPGPRSRGSLVRCTRRSGRIARPGAMPGMRARGSAPCGPMLRWRSVRPHRCHRSSAHPEDPGAHPGQRDGDARSLADRSRPEPCPWQWLPARQAPCGVARQPRCGSDQAMHGHGDRPSSGLAVREAACRRGDTFRARARDDQPGGVAAAAQWRMSPRRQSGAHGHPCAARIPASARRNAVPGHLILVTSAFSCEAIERPMGHRHRSSIHGPMRASQCLLLRTFLEPRAPPGGPWPPRSRRTWVRGLSMRSVDDLVQAPAVTRAPKRKVHRLRASTTSGCLRSSTDGSTVTGRICGWMPPA